MISRKIKVLVADDSKTDFEIMARELEKIGGQYEFRWVTDRDGFEGALKDYAPDIVLCDYRMPAFDAIEALNIARVMAPDTPFIVVSGAVGEEIVAQVIQRGATDYVLKDKIYRLGPAIMRALQEAKERAGHKRADEVIKQSEARYRGLYENMPSAMAVYEAIEEGADFIFKDFNPSAEKIENIGKDAVLGRRVTDIFPGIRQMGLLDVFRRVWKTGKAEHFTSSLYFDERVGTGWRDNRVYRLPNGEIVAIYDDVSDRKRAEESLRSSEERFRILFEFAPDAYYLIDSDGRIVDCNIKTEDLSGYNRQELRGGNLVDLGILPDDQLDKAREVMGKNSAGLSSGPDEFIIRRRDGSEVAVEVVTHPVRFQSNLITLGMARDITERKKVENTMLALNDCFLKFGPDPAKNIKVIVETAGLLLGGACALYNRIAGPAISTITGWNMPSGMDQWDTTEGRICYDAIRSGDRPLVVRNLGETSYATTDPNVEKYRLVSYIGQAVNIQGRPSASLCVAYQKEKEFAQYEVEAISILGKALGIEEDRMAAEEEKKRAYESLEVAQRKLIQSEKMAAVGRFASGVTHEVKNPLGIILSGAEFLETKLAHYNADVSSTIEKIKDASLRANFILQSLLQFAKPSELKIGLVTLEDVINPVVNMMASRARFAGIEILTEFSRDIPDIQADKSQMQQVIFNITKNAMESMEDGGKVRIRTYRDSRIRLPQDAPACVIEITDTGHGISEYDRLKLAEPFFTTRPEGKGTGLGLFVSKTIVENHGGRLIIDSEVGKGTKARIVMPISKAGGKE